VERVITLALAAWGLTWLLSFWRQLDGVRKHLGVGFDRDAGGNEVERWGSTRFGEWLNCPACCAVVSTAVVAGWWLMGLSWTAVQAVAVLGLATLIVRWWQSVRVKAEWWL
jgi:hypothetical protein